jgi:hypothetical protein
VGESSAGTDRHPDTDPDCYADADVHGAGDAYRITAGVQ